MGVSNDADEDGGCKGITKKETRMLFAINASEAVLMDSMTAEMQHNGCEFDSEKFIDVFRKYTPHFTQMLSGVNSDDSDDEDEHPLPAKYFPFLSAFSKSVDKFIAAIEKNYKVLCKKDLKEIDISVFTKHPEEIFKSYGKSIGHGSRSSSVLGSHANGTLPLFNSVRIGEEKMTSQLGIVDDSLAKMKITNISVDTDHGSLLSAQEEELRTTTENSDTPTPTIEDWHVVEEERPSSEWRNDITSKSKHDAPDAVPIVVPPMGQMAAHNEPRSLSPLSNPAKVTNIEDQVKLLMNGLKDMIRKVHQDIRFALTPMMERLVRALLKDKRPLTIREFIGEEFYDERLEQFVIRMISKDTSLHQMVKLEFVNGGNPLVHLGPLITKDSKTNNNREEIKDREEVEETNEEKQMKAPVANIDVNFYPDSSQFSQHLKVIGGDVEIVDSGELKITRSQLYAIVDAQLLEIRKMKMDHLSLSHVHSLEQGKTVLLKSDDGSYCRGVVEKEWSRDASVDEMVKCFLVDFGESFDVPIELMYAFPQLAEEVAPAVKITAKLKAFPRGAKSETDTFSPSDWQSIGDLLNEWKKSTLDVCIMSREGRVFGIDVKNEKGESLIDDLVKRGLAQKDVSPPPSSGPVPSFTRVSSSLAQPLTLPVPLYSVYERETGGEGILNIVKGVDIPASMNGITECGSAMNAPPSSVIVARGEPERKGYLENPSTGGLVPSFLQFIPQPVQVSPPTVLGLTSPPFVRPPGRIQVLGDVE